MLSLSRTIRQDRATVAAWAGRVGIPSAGEQPAAGVIAGPVAPDMLSQDGGETVRDVDRALAAVLWRAELHTAVIGPLDLPGDPDLLAEKVHIRHAQCGCLAAAHPSEGAHGDEGREPVVGDADCPTDLLGGRDPHRRRRLARPGKPNTVGDVAAHEPIAHRGADHVAHIGEPGGPRRISQSPPQSADISELSRYSEIGQQDPSFIVLGFCKQDVCGLDVTVQKAPLVGVVERPGDCGDDGAHVMYWHPGRVLIFHQLAGVGAFDVVHRDPQLAIELAPIMYPDDMRMPQRGGQVGFAVESLAEFAVCGHRLGKDFYSVATRQPGVLSEVDLAHPTRTQQPQDGVPSETRAAHQRHALNTPKLDFVMTSPDSTAAYVTRGLITSD